MKRIFVLAAAIVLTLGLSETLAQNKSDKDVKEKKKQAVLKDEPKGAGRHFVDKNGDGFNDNAPDHDGDGIPNCIDPDFKNWKMRHGKKFIDRDGDGINDAGVVNKLKKSGYGFGKNIRKGNNNKAKGK